MAALFCVSKEGARLATLRVRRTGTFAVVAQRPLGDAKLSWGARGMMAYLLMQPNNWHCDLDSFVTDHGSTPRSEVWAILKELGERRYITKNADEYGSIEYVVTIEDSTSLRIEDLAVVIKAYPNHRKPHGAPQSLAVAQAWNEAVAANEVPPLTEILLDLSKRRKGHDWTKEEGRYVPSLHTYIERRMWTYPIHPDPPKDRRDFNSGGVGELVL
jgi:hypothetical protein